MRLLLRGAAVVVMLLWSAVPAAAQTAALAYVGRPISEVRLLVEGRQTDDPSLKDLLETRVGQPLAMEDVRESIAHLYTLGRFQDVRVEAASAAGGTVSLEYTAIPLHSVQRIDFRGDLGLSEGVLRRAVTDRYGVSPPVGRAADMATNLERLYRDRGYLSASVRPIAEERHDPDRTLLTFEIQSGPQAKIGKVNVEGALPTSEPEFLRTLQASVGDPYQPPELQRRLGEYLNRVRQRGFYEAKGRLSADPAENGTVELTIEVAVGPNVSVRFEGDSLPAARLKELVPVDREASVEEDMLEDSTRRIEAYLAQQGYWKARAPYRREEGQGTVTIVFSVTRGRQFHVSDVAIRGGQAITADQLRALVPIKPGDLFLESKLSAGVAAIAADYRKRGFASAGVKPAVTELDPPQAGQGLVRIDVVVNEGPRTLVGDVTITGSTALGQEELRKLIHARAGDAFYPPVINDDRDAIIVRYLNLGYASADVTVTPKFSDDRTRADLDFRIVEGPQTLVDHVLIVGNTKTDPKVILREMRLKPGQPLGLEDQIESQRALNALGLFRRVRITELRHGDATRHDLLVTVDEAPRTTISYGGGAEAQQRVRTAADGTAEQRLEFAPRGFFDIGRRNVGGKNRTLDFYTRVSLRPNDAPDDPSQDGQGYGLSQYRVVGTYREPRAIFGSDATLTAATEQGIRSSFNFTRSGVSADLVRRLTPAIRVTGRYSFSTTRTYDERLSEEEQATIDRLFPQVRLSVFSGAIARDTRDDILEPGQGTFLSAEGSMAVRVLGGEVGFLKTYLQGFWFKRLPGPRRIVFATRAAIGLADGFPREVQVDDGAGGTRVETVEDLPASERFFAGGDTSIRGFGLDLVGITPQTISPNGFPRGGNAVLILNGELRVPVWKQIGAAIFMDGGNVWSRVTNVDLGEVRGTYGFGVRYQSPVGPIRFDIGFKMDRRIVGGSLEPPRALHFSIGQAF